MKIFKRFAVALLLLTYVCLNSCEQNEIQELHVLEINEIILTTENHYDNPYTDVECWVDLKGRSSIYLGSFKLSGW